MEFSNFKKHIQKLSNAEIGGLEAQFKLAPKLRKQFSEEKIKANNPKKAAVLVIFYPNNKGKMSFLLTLRASYNGTHSSQISFPGGKFDLKDVSLDQTALREAYEEIGIVKNGNNYLYYLYHHWDQYMDFIKEKGSGYVLGGHGTGDPSGEAAVLAELGEMPRIEKPVDPNQKIGDSLITAAAKRH